MRVQRPHKVEDQPEQDAPAAGGAEQEKNRNEQLDCQRTPHRQQFAPIRRISEVEMLQKPAHQECTATDFRIEIIPVELMEDGIKNTAV